MKREGMVPTRGSLPVNSDDRQIEYRKTSGVVVKPLYADSTSDAEVPGKFPFTRGPYDSMYRGRLWTMRQYAGFGTAEETNQRFKALLEAGQTGLSVAFDLPTQLGLDSDAILAQGEVGKVGVAIDSIEDMRRLFDGIPLGEISTSMTINSTAAILLLLYHLVAEERGVAGPDIRGTVQNDILKEYIARGTYIYPPSPSMRIVTDLFSYCAEELPNWNTISISGYHIREAGSTAAQEIAFTIANGLAYVTAAMEAGLDVDDFAPRLSFFWNAHNDFFEEIAKYRAARRMWATLMRDRIGARSPASWRMRFHTQTAGSSLTAQQPENNIARTTIQAMAAVLGGTQSLHTNSFDEALGLPTEHAATLALRTQQVIGYESGVTDTPDPLGGSYFVEALTDELESRALAMVEDIDQLGGAVSAIEFGHQADLIGEAAYQAATDIESGDQVVVGVNRFTDETRQSVPTLTVDPQLERDQVRRLVALRSGRDQPAVDRSLEELAAAAAGNNNLLYPMKTALARLATLGEVSEVLRTVFGVHRQS